MKQKKNILETLAFCASLAAASAAAGCAAGCAVQRYAETADGTRLEVVAETDASGVEKFYVVGADGSRAEISPDAVREETVLDPDVKDAAASVAESFLLQKRKRVPGDAGTRFLRCRKRDYLQRAMMSSETARSSGEA